MVWLSSREVAIEKLWSESNLAEHSNNWTEAERALRKLVHLTAQYDLYREEHINASQHLTRILKAQKKNRGSRKSPTKESRLS